MAPVDDDEVASWSILRPIPLPTEWEDDLLPVEREEEDYLPRRTTEEGESHQLRLQFPREEEGSQDRHHPTAAYLLAASLGFCRI